MKVRLKLIILTMSSNELLVLTNNGLPEVIPTKSLLETYSFQESMHVLIKEYLEIHTGWLSIALVDAYFKDNTAYIVYGVKVPDMIKNTKGTWQPVGEMDDSVDKRLIYQASLRS